MNITFYILYSQQEVTIEILNNPQKYFVSVNKSHSVISNQIHLKHLILRIRF